MENAAPKRKRGRPRVTGRKPSEGRPVLSARVGRDMYAAAVELAAAEKITLANWVRNALISRILQTFGMKRLNMDATVEKEEKNERETYHT